MSGDQFRVQELNPFLEWHLHTTAISLEVASEEAKRIARMIGRKTRVLSEDGTVLTEVDPEQWSPFTRRRWREPDGPALYLDQRLNPPCGTWWATSPLCRWFSNAPSSTSQTRQESHNAWWGHEESGTSESRFRQDRAAGKRRCAYSFSWLPWTSHKRDSGTGRNTPSLRRGPFLIDRPSNFPFR